MINNRAHQRPFSSHFTLDTSLRSSSTGMSATSSNCRTAVALTRRAGSVSGGHHVAVDASLQRRLDNARLSNDGRLLVDLGCELADAGDHLDAAWCFQRAVAVGEQWAAFNLGNELRELGRDREAVAAYAHAVEANENDAWLNMGNALERLGDLVGALRAYEQGQATGDVNAGLARAFLLREIDDRNLAEQVVTALAREGSGLADAIGACWQWDRTFDPGLESRLRAGAELYPSARQPL